MRVRDRVATCARMPDRCFEWFEYKGRAPPREGASHSHLYPGPILSDRLVFACSCERTMSLDTAVMGQACGGELRTADQLCGRELDRFREALATGRPVTEPIFLPGSHRAWVPVATAESWGGGGEAVCNGYRYQFDRVRVVRQAGAGWLKLASGTTFQDPGYRVLVKGAGSFFASRAETGSTQPVRQTFGVSR